MLYFPLLLWKHEQYSIVENKNNLGVQNNDYIVIGTLEKYLQSY